MAYQLPPVQPMGMVAGYTYPHTVTLILREKVMSLSGDSFDICFQNGPPVFTVEGSVLSLTGRKTLRDAHSKVHLFDIQKELLHIHATFVAKAPSGQQLLQVKSSFALLGSKATGTFNNAFQQGKPESLKMKGNWFDSAADIVDEKTGQVVGRIDRKILSGRDLLFGQQTYALTVAPNVDVALMVAMCICMDEKNNEGKGGLLG